MTAIRNEMPGDRESIQQVNRLAFGGEDEARIIDRLWKDGLEAVSLVAKEQDRTVGHILFSRLPIETQSVTIEAVALAPMAVAPTAQRKGIGSALVRQGLDACKRLGYKAVVVWGYPEFYPRFGFSPALAEKLSAPFSGDAFMAMELQPGALDGIKGKVSYPDAFFP